MGRRHSIAGKKAAGDAAKSKNYAKIGKIIQIAARSGADPDMNPQLQLALQKAKYYSLPKDVIDKAIKKGSGQLEGEQLQEITYEGYGPAGIAVVIKALTSNSNRANSNLKVIMTKGGGNLGQEGAVLWQFSEDGVIVIDGISKKEIVKGNQIENILPFVKDELELQVMEFPIKDVEIEGNQAIVYTQKKDFTLVRNEIEKLNYHISHADIEFLPNSTVKVDEASKQQMLDLLEAIEEDEDVNGVFHNMEI